MIRAATASDNLLRHLVSQRCTDVFVGATQPIVVGDSLTVTGTVTEFQASSASLTVTEITGSTAVRNSQGNTLPAAIVIGTGGRMPPTENYEDDNFTSFNPATDALDFYESREGMRVTIDAPLVVAATNSFGETWTVASGGAGATGVTPQGHHRLRGRLTPSASRSTTTPILATPTTRTTARRRDRRRHRHPQHAFNSTGLAKGRLP